MTKNTVNITLSPRDADLILEIVNRADPLKLLISQDVRLDLLAQIRVQLAETKAPASEL